MRIRKAIHKDCNHSWGGFLGGGGSSGNQQGKGGGGGLGGMIGDVLGG